MTVDGVIDQTDRWFIPEGEHEDESYDQLPQTHRKRLHVHPRRPPPTRARGQHLDLLAVRSWS
jgi:hypothetical protein